MATMLLKAGRLAGQRQARPTVVWRKVGHCTTLFLPYSFWLTACTAHTAGADVDTITRADSLEKCRPLYRDPCYFSIPNYAATPVHVLCYQGIYSVGEQQPHNARA